jgi:hypothetical protein
MNQQQKIAQSISHEYRVKILMLWMPHAKMNLSDENYKNLWNAYFIYVDPDGVKKPDCAVCRQNVYDQWVRMKPYLIEAEKEYRVLENI